MFNKFTERARKVILLAKQEAKRFNHDYIGTEHILLGLLREGEGVAAAVLQSLGMNLNNIRLEVEKLVQIGPPTVVSGDLPFTPKAKKVMELAMDEAKTLGHNYIGTEHLLLGLIREGEGVASQVFMNMGLDLEKVREEVIKLLGSTTPGSQFTPLPSSGGHGNPTGPASKTKTPALDAFGRDLTKLAKEGKLDPVIGRADEIERVMQTLSRRRKNNPVLLGEAGVGKSAIVEGLAQKIISGDVPEILRNRRVITLDLALMVAGTKYRGQFEERIKAVMDEIKRSENIIMFVDELHTLVGAGGAEGAIDASNILKPALARGEIQCIGATTLDEYRKYIEKDSALERRFQTIIVDPPSVEETVLILRGLRDRYETHHKIKILDSALEAAAKLSDRYIAGRFLPDKAIDVIDEAGAHARLSTHAAPPEVKELEKKLELLKREKEDTIKEQDFEKAAALRDQERELRRQIDKTKKEWMESRSKIELEIGEDDIAQIVSKMTGIPISRLEEKEQSRLLRMEDELRKRIVGQEEAISTIAHAVRRSRAGLKDPRRPIGSFIFLGPTGVGKTLLAKALAEFMFNDENALISFDMSEYMEKFNVSRLVGAPPGYVGYEEGGQLTERVRRRPYCIVLLDEIEKAHPDVFNMLLQVLEEGRLTDSVGRKVDFRNVLLIMTSNIGADLLRKQGSIGFKAQEFSTNYKDMKTRLMEEVKKTFKPEFINRVDDSVVFQKLTREDLYKIVDIEVDQLRKRLSERDIEIQLDQKAKDFLINKGFDLMYGARPLRRTLQRYLEDPLSEEIIAKRIKPNEIIRVSMKDDDRLLFEQGANISS
ncbi:MAG: NDP-hexose 4-ketoreductase [Candidatus Omnitrophica bacterium CG07_land_8_20_14_0_80_50_8]|nr:MAG: NDP-hexose 4-ketoreductase [Candidatus Omnitrophica bacterium CG07_land_8_20_14_0_80_50_8]